MKRFKTNNIDPQILVRSLLFLTYVNEATMKRAIMK